MKPLIEFKDVSFQYHSQSEPTLHDLNIAIYPGEKILVVGPSGSGKSTFAHCMNGLIPHMYTGALKGSVEVNGKDVSTSSLSSLSFDIGTVLQDTDGQFIGLSVAEDIAFSLENECVPQSEMQEAVKKMAEMVYLTNHLSHRPQDLSGGQKQRVSMAGVLVDEVPILLLDEPLANLDPKTGKESMVLLDELNKQYGATIIIVEHRLEDVLYRDVDRILVFSEGRIISDSSPDELLKQTLLADIGIREPLYISAMKYAGVDLSRVEKLAFLPDVSTPELKTQMQEWVSDLPQPRVAPKQPSLLAIKDLTVRYESQGKSVLQNLSIDFHAGEMVSIVGENGAGKSTLCKAICGFIPTQSGQLMWEDEDFNALSIKERADYVGYVMQNPNQMISKKMIREEVSLGLVLRGVAEEEIEERVTRVLKICGLYPFRNWPISALSFGQKKRVTIASILVLNPKMILLDEPTAGQDLKHYTEMMDFLSEISHQGVSVGMVTHDMHLMLEYTNRTIVIGEGHVLADDTPAHILTNQQIVETASLKETSLFTFSQQLGMLDPVSFTEKFIAFDREARLK